MKTTSKATKQITVVLATVLAASAGQALADQQAMPAPGADKCYTGQVVSVNPQENTLRVKSWLFSNRKFNLGANCSYAMAGRNNATAATLQPGDKVTVYYQDSHGVLIADRVAERTTQVEGMVTVIDANKHTLILHERGLDQPMQIASDCIVTLRDNKSGTLSGLQTGDHVTVTYDAPNDVLTARQISQTSLAFTGDLTAIDLSAKTVKAQDTFDHTMKFNLADNCAIVINGQANGKLDELRPDEKLVFDYNTINGVNVVNRIAPAPQQRDSTFTTTYPYPSPTY